MTRILNKLRIDLKLGGGFVLIVFILTLSVVLCLFQMSRLNSGMTDLYFRHTLPIQELGEANALVGQIKSNLQLYIQIPRPQFEGGEFHCGACHIAELSGTHHLLQGQSEGDVKRCISCHAQQTSSADHGRSVVNTSNVQECASCHPSDVIAGQREQVKQSITAEVGRINLIVSSYREDLLLTDAEKNELEDFDSDWNAYQKIITDLLEQADGGDKESALHRLVGGDAQTVQAGLQESISRLVTINQELASQAQKDGANTFKASSWLTLIFGVIGIIFAGWLGWAITMNIRSPLAAMVNLSQNLQQGNLTWGGAQADIFQRSDELGLAGRSLDRTVQYLQEVAAEAGGIAAGDMTVAVTPRGEQDVLGISISKMADRFRELLKSVSESSQALIAASKQLSSVSTQTTAVTRQISASVQQAALGNEQQNGDVAKTTASIVRVNHEVSGVFNDTQGQAQAIDQASVITSRIRASIEQVSVDIQSVTKDSARSVDLSRNGAKIVQDTITGMEAIRRTVGASASRMEDLGARSEEIGTIVATIEDISSQTNLLALNAAIEAARATGSGARVSEQLIQQHLIGAAEMLAELCKYKFDDLRAEDLVALARLARVGTFNITDDDGVVILSDEPGSIGFRFPEDVRQQAAAFRPLIKQQDGVLAQPARPRTQDGVLYIYVGVSRRDRPGVVQAGMSALVMEKSDDFTRGFAVVADEVRKLAERAGLATREISVLIKRIQSTVKEAVSAMASSASEVEAGMKRANSAGGVLDGILKAGESVHQQAEDAETMAVKINAAVVDLVNAVDAVSKVTGRNVSATESMSLHASSLGRDMENITRTTEKNTALMSEMSASTHEISERVNLVSASAAALREISERLIEEISRFKLK